MKSIKTLALVTGLLALSGVSQAQFSSTWTAVSDYDFRGFSQSGKDPAMQASADYAFGESDFRLAPGRRMSTSACSTTTSRLDFYVNYVGQDQRHVRLDGGRAPGTTTRWVTTSTVIRKPISASTPAASASSSGTRMTSSRSAKAPNTPKPTTRNPLATSFSLAFHAGYSWGDYWDAVGDEAVDYAVQGQLQRRQLHDLRQVHGNGRQRRA